MAERARRTPVNLLEFEGARYLASPRGHTQWVRNLAPDHPVFRLSQPGMR